MNNNITNLLGIPNISSNKHYWVIRTNGGEFYSDFVMNNYVSISWDYITLSMLYDLPELEIKRIIDAYERNISPSPDDEDCDGTPKSKITSILNKLKRFVFEINKGDILLIPSRNSDFICIAEVISDAYETDNYLESYFKANPETSIIPCPYKKRRKINILKTIQKSDMDIYLAKGFNSQHALSNMDEYAPFINRTIYDIYSIDEELHTTLHAGHPNGLSLKELTRFLNYLDACVDDIATQCEMHLDEQDLQVKLNIHSPGLIELIGIGAAATASLSLLIFAINNILNGGSFKVSFKKDNLNNIDFSIESSTPGIRGNDQKDKEINLKEKELLLTLVKELDIKGPNLISAIANSEKITPDMISGAENNSGNETTTGN